MSARFGTPVLIAVACLSGGALAQENALKRQEFRTVTPAWVAPGQKAAVQIYGQDLKPTELKFDHPGFAASILKTEPFAPKGDDERRRGNSVIQAEVTLPAGLSPGRYPFVLSGPGVRPERGFLNVDVPAPEIAEQEPNDSLRKPQSLPTGSVTVLGKLDGDGVDVFRIQGKAGETWRFEVYARRLTPPTKLEAVLRLRDSRLAPLRAAVDQGDDCFIQHRLPADGAYTVEIFDGDNRTGGEYSYRLAVRRL